MAADMGGGYGVGRLTYYQLAPGGFEFHGLPGNGRMGRLGVMWLTPLPRHRPIVQRRAIPYIDDSRQCYYSRNTEINLAVLILFLDERSQTPQTSVYPFMVR